MDVGDDDLEETEKINVVPLADLTLVLLIVLMVLSPMITQSMIHVSAPTVESQEVQEGAEPELASTPLLIEVSETGQILNNEVFTTLPELLNVLSLRLESHRKRPVVVRADPLVSVGRVVSVLDGAKQAGATVVSLVGNPSAEGDQ